MCKNKVLHALNRPSNNSLVNHNVEIELFKLQYWCIL